MAYTPLQWDKIQSTMPQEDRVSYTEYLKVADPAEYKRLTTPAPTGSLLSRLKADAQEPRTNSSVSAAESAAQKRALEREQKAREQAEIDYATKILPGGLTQAQIDSIAGAKTTAGLIGGTVDPKTGYVTSQYETPEQKAKREALAAKIAADQKAAADKTAADLKAKQDAADKALADKTASEAELAKLLAQRAEIEATQKRIAEIQAKIARGEDISNEDRIFLKLGPITASSATDTLGKQPGAGWIKSPDGKSWIKPTMPTETGFSFSWDDEKGWIRFKVGSNKTIKSTTYTGTGKNRKRIVTYNDDTTETFDDPEGAGSKTIISTKYQGTGKDRKRIITYSDDTVDVIDDPEIVAGSDGTGGTGGTSGSATGGFTQKDIDAAVAAALAKANETTADRDKKANALASLTSRFSKYGLESLIPKIRELVINGSTEATIALELAETEEYKQRFKANQERLKKGLSVLDPGTYIGMEDSYRQALRAYGLKQFDTDDYVSQFIANDISANELSNRIVTAVQRVQNADPAITKQLKDFYNIGQNDLVAYVLDPNQQFQKIERQVQAAEIGVAAARQGINTGVQVAEQLAAQGVTQAEAQKGYATIADILPDAKKLSDIYGTTLEGYDLGQAEQEVFNQLASAQRRRQKLSAREIAAFGGSSGTNKTSLTESKVGQF
jgi:hypothetical protein